VGISKKNRHKIVYNGVTFLWWVDPEFDGLGNMLSVNIASEDKKFLIKHFVVQIKSERSYISVIGEYFPGLERKTGNSIRLSCPSFSNSFADKGITPKTVKEILQWCFDNNARNQELKPM
jgi:hypothetical protein